MGVGGQGGPGSAQGFECHSPTLLQTRPRTVMLRCNSSGEGNAGGRGAEISCAAHSARGERQCQALDYRPAHSAAAAVIPAFALLHLQPDFYTQISYKS